MNHLLAYKNTLVILSCYNPSTYQRGGWLVVTDAIRKALVIPTCSWGEADFPGGLSAPLARAVGATAQAGRNLLPWRELWAWCSPDSYLQVFTFQDSGSDLNVYIVNARSTGNGRLKHKRHGQQKQRSIDKDHVFMTEDKEAETRVQGIELLEQRKGKWEG